MRVIFADKNLYSSIASLAMKALCAATAKKAAPSLLSRRELKRVTDVIVRGGVHISRSDRHPHLLLTFVNRGARKDVASAHVSWKFVRV